MSDDGSDLIGRRIVFIDDDLGKNGDYAVFLARSTGNKFGEGPEMVIQWNREPPNVVPVVKVREWFNGIMRFDPVTADE